MDNVIDLDKFRQAKKDKQEEEVLEVKEIDVNEFFKHIPFMAELFKK